MTNSSPPEPKSDSQKPLGLDEWIGIVVALATMGIIFFWVTGSKPGWKLAGTQDLFSPKELSRTPAVDELPARAKYSWYGITRNNEVDFESSAERDLALEAEEKSRLLKTKGVSERKNLQSLASETALPAAIGISGVGMLTDAPGISSPGVPVDAAANGDTDGPTAVKSSRSVDLEGSEETATPADSSQGEVPGSVALDGSEETDSPLSDGSSSDGSDGAKVAASSESIEFSDLTDKYWAKEFIVPLAAKDIISSYPDGTFQPERSITRAEFTTNLDGVFGRKPKDKEVEYDDVEEDYSAEPAIEFATNVGAMTGYPDGDFRPEKLISRMEVLIALATGLNLTPPSNVDEVLEIYEDRDKIPGWAKEKVAAATASGLVVNYPEPDILNPIEPASRAEAAAMLHQALVFRGVFEPVDSQYVVTVDE